MVALYTLADRVANRLMRHLPDTRLFVGASRPIVTFTFDDVPTTALTNGARVLEAHGVRGTFYIAGGLAGRVESDRQLIEIDGVRELAARGHEVGCHTFAHDNIRRLRRDALVADLDRNARYLAEAVPGFKAHNFAFPYNLASPLARDVLAARYRTCRGGWEGINRGPTDPGYLKSVEIRQPEEHSLGLTRWIDDVAANPGWLIFFTHDLADVPTRFGCSPATLDHLVDHALARGCDVLTIDAALDVIADDAAGSAERRAG